MAFPTAAVATRGGNERSEFSLNTDGEMMKYLERIVRGYPIPPTDPVHVLKDKDFYQFNPKQLSEMYQMGAQDSLYFITSPLRQIIRPVASGGYWEDTCFGAIIAGTWGTIRTIKGSSKTLIYCEGEPKSGIWTEWRLRECKLVQIMQRPNPKVDELVLYKVYKVCDPSFFEAVNLKDIVYDDEFYEVDMAEDTNIDEDEFFEDDIVEETNIDEDD